MAEIPAAPEKDAGALEMWVGVCVVLLATFLGICSVKSSNIVQQMQVKQNDRNNNWAWYQARNIREAVYEATADELSVPGADESEPVREAREKMAKAYHGRAEAQREKQKVQEQDAKDAEAAYKDLSNKDDLFDLSEAALALGLAMMGVTALLKRWWLFAVSLVPAGFGVFMGVAGFLGVDTSGPFRGLIDLLS